VNNCKAAVTMVTMQGGVFGSVATSAAFLTALGFADIPGTPDLPST
jgi:hypothetical protein